MGFAAKILFLFVFCLGMSVKSNFYTHTHTHTILLAWERLGSCVPFSSVLGDEESQRCFSISAEALSVLPWNYRQLWTNRRERVGLSPTAWRLYLYLVHCNTPVIFQVVLICHQSQEDSLCPEWASGGKETLSTVLLEEPVCSNVCKTQ